MSDAQTDAEELVNAVLPHAEGMLIAHGEFFPFGASMSLDGKITADDYQVWKNNFGPIAVCSARSGGSMERRRRAGRCDWPNQP